MIYIISILIWTAGTPSQAFDVMENYVRVKTPLPEQKVEENEIRVTAAGKSRNYISFANSLLTEKRHSSVILRGMGKAINKAVAIAEIVKRRIAGLHQNIVISSLDITDIWEPKEGTQGLDRIETVRQASVIIITLSKDAPTAKGAGYQEPLPESEVKPLEDEADIAGEADEEGEGERPRSRRPGGRGGRGRGRRGRPAGAAEGGAAEATEGAAGEGEGAPKEGGARGRRRRNRGRRSGGKGEEGAPAANAEAAAQE